MTTNEIRYAANALRKANAIVCTTTEWDGWSAVKVDADGMVRSVGEVTEGHNYALYAELGGRVCFSFTPYPF